MKCVKRLTADQQRLAEENLTIVERVLRFDINANPCVAGLGYEDLYQEGCVWLCNAALTFDPARGSFASYARQVVQNGLVSYCRNLTGKQSRMISLAEMEPTALAALEVQHVMWNLEVSDLDLQEEFKAEYGLSTDALFVDSEVNKGGNRLESYARALERSKKMMQIIDTAIDLMRRKHKKGEFYYWILYYAYLSPQQCENAGAILQLLETKGISISLRTYYVHRDEAIEVLSSILWGYTSQDCEKITNLLTPD